MLHFLLIESELFVFFLITIITHIVKQFVQTMYINYLSHFIIINSSYYHKTKLYQYNTLLMSIKI
jgi:hypothetical protein